MIARLLSHVKDICAFQVIDKEDDVRHAAVRKTNGMHPVFQLQRDVESDVCRIAHANFYIIADNLGFVNAGVRQKAHLFRDDAVQISEFRDASRAVAARLHLAAIGIEVAHPKIDIGCLFG